MKLSKKSRYGLRALIDLSVNSKSDQVSLNSIAERNSISPQYLEHVFAGLRRAGIVKSIKGPQGGYLLNHAPEDITVADILDALEGNYRMEEEEVADNCKCKGIADSIQKLLIDEANSRMDELLTGLTLADLEKDYVEGKKYNQEMYYI